MRPFHVGAASLYLGDCREILPTLTVGAIIADPPYGMGYRSGHNSSRTGAGASMVRKDGNFQPIAGDRTAFDPAHLLAVDVPTILWGAQHYSAALPSGRKWLVWDKLAGKTPAPSGSDVELAWTSESGPARIFQHLWRGIMRAGEENVTNGGKLHPNQKPVALLQWCLQQIEFSGPVFDGYMGSGSLGVACLRAGIPYIGCEIEPNYFNVACDRLDAEARQGRLIA